MSHPKCPACGNRENFYVMQFHITQQDVTMRRGEEPEWEANTYDTCDEPDIVYGVYCGQCDRRLKGKTADAIYLLNGPENVEAIKFADSLGILDLKEED